MLVGSYFCICVFHLLNFNINNILFDTKYFFQKKIDYSDHKNNLIANESGSPCLVLPFLPTKTLYLLL